MGENLGQWLSIGALAQRSGVSVATLRFYEDRSLFGVHAQKAIKDAISDRCYVELRL